MRRINRVGAKSADGSSSSTLLHVPPLSYTLASVTAAEAGSVVFLAKALEADGTNNAIEAHDFKVKATREAYASLGWQDITDLSGSKRKQGAGSSSSKAASGSPGAKKLKKEKSSDKYTSSSVSYAGATSHKTHHSRSGAAKEEAPKAKSTKIIPKRKGLPEVMHINFTARPDDKKVPHFWTEERNFPPEHRKITRNSTSRKSKGSNAVALSGESANLDDLIKFNLFCAGKVYDLPSQCL